MRRWIATASLPAFVAAAVAASAQTYSAPTPQARSTDPGTLVAQARAREVHERFARGVAAEERGDWSAAAQEFTRVVALDPPEPKGSSAHYDLALAQTHLGRDDAAVACSKKPSIVIRVSRRRPRTSSRWSCGAAIWPARAEPRTAT